MTRNATLPGNTPIAITNIHRLRRHKIHADFRQSAVQHQGNYSGVSSLQDNWNVRPGLTLNLGVVTKGKHSPTDNNNIAPRLGFAWQIPHPAPRFFAPVTASTILKFAPMRPPVISKAGRRASSLSLPLPASADSQPASRLSRLSPRYSLRHAALEAVSPACPSAASPLRWLCGFPRSVPEYFALRFYPHSLLNPYTQQWTLGLEQEIARGWVALAGLPRLAHGKARSQR